MTNYKTFETFVSLHILVHGKPHMIVTGNGSGADEFARRYAKDKGMRCGIVDANYEKHGKDAARRRDKAIISVGHHIMIFHRSEGKRSRRLVEQARSAELGEKKVVFVDIRD